MQTHITAPADVSIDTLVARAHELAEHGRTLAREAEQLEASIKLARGTSDVTAQAAAATRITTPARGVPVRPSGEYSSVAPATPAPVQSPTMALYEQIRAMITDRPMRFREIVEATKLGAEGENRIKGVLVRLQRDRAGVVNLGDGARALWFIPDDSLLERLRNVKKAAKR